jgi:polyhydroxyalkanoate synthase subunit PhaC
MAHSPEMSASALPPSFDALQQRPRPLPVFLDLLRRMTAGEPERMRRALAGLRRYQEAERAPAPKLMPVLAERRGASLRDYGGMGPDLLFVPSLINPPTVLDLGRRSLLRWLRERGRRVLLLDWGWPDAARRDLSVAGHVEEILLPLMRELAAPPDLAGYCLGGTMAAAGAQLGAARSLILIAAPWHFGAFEAERQKLTGLWQRSRPMAERLGVLPMEVLQTAFWSLDPARTVRKFEELVEADDAALRAFVTLEDWANDGPPLPFAAARELLEDFFAADLPGRGLWHVAGQRIAPETLPCPLLNIVSTSDRIVPAVSAVQAGERLELARGHVGMVVGSRSREELWQPLADWLSRVSPT